MGTVDRRPYLTATTLDQDLLDQMADNLDFDLRMVADIDAPAGGTIRVSDRHGYVGGDFYVARCTFPAIKRTIGQWLSPSIEFSTLEIPISNVDGIFNKYLPAGANFDGWIGREVDIKIGLREVAASYFSIFNGVVTDIGGLSRDRSVIKVRTRDKLDRLNQQFPKTLIDSASWPDAEDNIVNTILPVIYGDWTVAPFQEVPDPLGGAAIETANIPAFVVNGKNASVLSGIANVRLLVSENDNGTFQTTHVWVRRGETWGEVDSASVVSVVSGRDFQVVQGFTFDGGAYVYQPGDAFYCRVKGKDLSGYDDNAVWQARDILITQGGASTGEFASNWATFRDKSTPSVSAISTIKSRVWKQDQESAVTYALSILEQVRLEMFVDRDLNLKLSSLHLEDFVAAPTHAVRQWDLAAGSFQPRLDDQNIWNRVRAQYAFDPVAKEQARKTKIYQNAAAVAQAGKEISKEVIFPNLYVEAEVVDQAFEMLRLASGYPEFIDMTLNPRAMLLDVGDFVRLNISMGSVVFEDVPAMIREIGYDPQGRGVTLSVWSFQMIDFDGWNPGYPGMVGGFSAAITEG